MALGEPINSLPIRTPRYASLVMNIIPYDLIWKPCCIWGTHCKQPVDHQTLSSKTAALLVLHDCLGNKQCVMYLDNADQGLDVPSLVLQRETDNWWRFSCSLQMLHFIERLNITSQVAAYLSAACLLGPVALTADLIASHWGRAKFYPRFLFWISFPFILTYHFKTCKHGTVKAVILVLQNNEKAIMLGV